MRKQSHAIVALFTLAASFAISASVSAQGAGVIGGIAVGSIPQAISGGFGQSAGVNTTTGFALGLSAESAGAVGFGANLLYSRRDFEYSPYAETHHLSYVDVPVYIKVTLPAHSMSPFVLVGPQGSVREGCNDSCATDQPWMTFAAIAGAGVKFGTLHRISLQARYVYGFTNEETGLGPNPGGRFGPPTTFRTRSLLLLAGIGF